MLSWTIQEYLLRNNVPYELIAHPRTATADETAHVAHIPEHIFAKTVVVRIDGQMSMIVLHADERLDLERVKNELGVDEVELCPEGEFKRRFPDCEVGAMPPFGDLWRMPVLVSKSLLNDEVLVMNGGTHTDLIKMPYSEFERLVHPRALDCTYH